MKYTVYALSSRAHLYVYVGLTSNLFDRIHRHNSGRERTTKPYRPFDLLYKEEHNTRVEARLREKYFKSGSGKEYLKTIRDNTTD